MQRQPSLRRPTRVRNETEDPAPAPAPDENMMGPPTNVKLSSATSSVSRSQLDRTRSLKMPTEPVTTVFGRTSQISSNNGDAPRLQLGKSKAINTTTSTQLPQMRPPMTKSHKRTQSLALPSFSPSSTKPQAQFYSTPRPQRNVSTRVASTSSQTSSQGSRTSSIGYPPSFARHLVPKPAHSTSSHGQGPTPVKPSTFSTCQQNHSPPQSTLKRTSSVSTPRKPPLQLSPTPNNESLRLQTYLLQLSLLHESSHKTLKALTASARASFQARHAELQNIYASVLEIRRQAREGRNLLALLEWCGGNMVALTRKLSTLTGVLGDVCMLTEPEIGRYAVVTESFEAWVAWIEEVWKVRDVEESGASPGKAGFGGTVRHVGQENNGMGDKHDDDTENNTLTSIASLGDNIKSEIKHLQTIVNGMVLRMDDLTKSTTITSPLKTKIEQGACAKHDLSTPAILLQHANAFVVGMQEELQMMREVDFEVEAGEKMWMDERARRVREEIGEW